MINMSSKLFGSLLSSQECVWERERECCCHFSYRELLLTMILTQYLWNDDDDNDDAAFAVNNKDDDELYIWRFNNCLIWTSIVPNVLAFYRESYQRCQ